MKLNFLHRKKVALCVSIPHKETQFKACCDRYTDFWRHLSIEYGSTDTTVLWEKYSDTADAIDSCIDKLRKKGVVVFDEFSSSQFADVSESDVLIFMAHKTSQPEAVELWDTALTPDEFSEKIPESFKGTIDICCCNSVDILNRLRLRCPEHEYIIAPDAPMQVKIHAAMLPVIIKDMGRCGSYFLSFCKVYAQALAMQKEQERKKAELRAKLEKLEANDSSGLVTLGEKKNDMSTLYAPHSAARGETFEIQLYFHHPEDSNEVEIRAKSKDDSVFKIESKSLKLKLDDGDIIEARLLLDNNEGNDFEIKNNQVYRTEWDEMIENATFRILVKEKCKKTRCDCTMQLFVNEQTKGDIIFHVDVVDDVTGKDRTSASIDRVTTQEEKRAAAAEELRQLLLQRLAQESSNEEEKEVINRCLHLLNSNDAITSGHGNVFISSTGDLKKYRDAATAGIISLEKNLNPILYENWSAESIRPCDKCSEKVMECDYFILILGSRFGHVEEQFELSMTQLEYLVAVFSGKMILAFIEKDAIAGDEKQQKFMDKVRRERLVSEFGSEEVLKYQVEKALRRVVAI